MKYNQWLLVTDLVYILKNLCHDFFVNPKKNNFITVNEINVIAKISIVSIFSYFINVKFNILFIKSSIIFSLNFIKKWRR